MKYITKLNFIILAVCGCFLNGCASKVEYCGVYDPYFDPIYQREGLPTVVHPCKTNLAVYPY